MKEIYNFNVQKTTEDCIEWIRKWFKENGPECNVIIGMSGGKDSTIAAALCVKALGPERVIGIALPDSGQGICEADEICKFLGIHYMCLPIQDITAAFSDVWKKTTHPELKWSDQAVQNIPPRVRMSVLFAMAQTYKGRVCCTCNLSEDWIGYATIFGDDAGSFSPLGYLTVTEILQIGDYLGIPSQWVHKVPDDGLPGSCPDEEKFGFTYTELDKYIREDYYPEPEIREKIDLMYNMNLFKTQIIHVPSYQPENENLYKEIKEESE